MVSTCLIVLRYCGDGFDHLRLVPSLQDLAFFKAPRGWPNNSSVQYSWEPLYSSHQQAVRHTVQTFPEPYALKDFAAHLLGLHAPATEPGFGFCQQHLEFPSHLQVLSKLNVAKLQCVIGNWCFQNGMVH